MRRVHLAIFVALPAALAIGKPSIDVRLPTTPAECLDGVWEIQRVEHNGMPDHRQIGAHMTFDHGVVTFAAKEVVVDALG